MYRTGQERDNPMVAQINTTKKIPRISEYPLLGSLPSFMKERLQFFQRIAQKESVCSFHVGPVRMVMFNKPEYIQYILADHAADFDKGRIMHKAMNGSNGLFSSEGDFHRQQRKLLSPPFQPRHISSYADSIGHYGEQLQKTWRNDEHIDLNQQMISLTLSIIGKILFNADVFSETDELGAAMAIGFEHTVHVLTSLYSPPLSWPTPHNRRTRIAGQQVEKRIQRMIDERRNSTIERNDFLSILLQARGDNNEVMSDQQVMDECITLFGAGHETTAAALAWVWYFLCQNPTIYQRVQQEVDSVLQGRTPTFADLLDLPYCLQVFKETMRLYPPAAAIIRETLYTVEIDGYCLPEGTTIFLCPYTLHRIPEYFPTPEQFDPDRFAPEREKQLPRYAYIPFGAGPRICIGNHLALMEGQLLIATLAQRVTFSLIPGQTVEPDPTHNLALRPGGKVEAVVKRR
jgi:cytochrome P450